MSSWRECKLGELGIVVTGKTPSSKNPEDWGIEMPFVTPSDYKNYGKYALLSERNLSKDGISRLQNKVLPENSIMVTCIGSDMGKIVMNKIPVITNQQINSIIPDSNIVDSDFLYYRLVSLYETLRVYGSDGTAVPIVNKTDFENIETEIPPFEKQKAIAEILSSLDDKIDLLHRQNQTLESLAQTLFRQWFIEEAKEEWEEVLITDLFEVRDGTHDSPKQKEFGKKLLTSKHILKNKLDFESSYFISEEDFEKINQRSIVEQGDILFSMIGTIGLTYLEQSNEIDYAIKNIGLFKTSQNKKFMYFVYLWLNSSFGVEFIHENRSGSTQEYISLGSLRNIIFNLPNYKIIDLFNEKMEPIFEKINTNMKQIKSLENLRDTLLPKLLSGEVRVEI